MTDIENISQGWRKRALDPDSAGEGKTAKFARGGGEGGAARSVKGDR